MKPTYTNNGKENASRVPGFWDGVASIFGVNRPIETEAVSDADAILSDWENVGNDIRRAMGKFAKQ